MSGVERKDLVTFGGRVNVLADDTQDSYTVPNITPPIQTLTSLNEPDPGRSSVNDALIVMR